MTDLLVKKLTAEDFNPTRYVHDLSENSVGGLELKDQRQRIQQLSEDTNVQLKKNVYMNYMQFIETAKEISYLESEMYQLSHLITEQKGLFTSLLEFSVSGDKGPGSAAQDIIEVNPQEVKEKREKEKRKKLTALLEKVERCSHVMEVEDRFLLFDGDLVELNQDDYTAMQRVHAYLLNDSLMVATWLSDRRGPVRYRFEVLYLLDQVLPVNIKDRGNTKNSFKVLIFPDTRVFQAPNAKAKQDWLDELERAKRNKVTADEQKAEQAQQQQQKERQASISRDDSIESNNPFARDDDSLSNNPFLSDPGPLTSIGPPEWIQELPEDLDQAIAQRNFEDAVELLDKGREYFDSGPKNASSAEMRRSLDTKLHNLVEILQSELRVTPDKSLQGGPRAVRRATKLLVRLNRSTQACDLFLKHRGAILKAGLKRLRLEGKTVLYVKQLCTIYFHNLVETAREFTKAFPSSRSCTSAFVVWAHDEVKNFAVMFSRHVFSTQSSLTTVSECISQADNEAQRMTNIGLDLTFALHIQLLKDVEKWISDGSQKMIEAVKRRAQEDTWKVTQFKTKEELNKFIEDMNDIGVGNIQSYCIDDLTLGVTDNMIQFSRAFLGYLEDLLRLLWPETTKQINKSLEDVMFAEIQHCRKSLPNPHLTDQVPSIKRNSRFLLDVILSLADHRYAEATGFAHPTLASLHKHRAELLGEAVNNTTVSKYESFI